MAVIKRAKARSTGTVVEVWLTEEYGLDPEDGGKYVTVCEHGNTVQHDTREQALGWSAHPEQWCETGCRYALDQKKDS